MNKITLLDVNLTAPLMRGGNDAVKIGEMIGRYRNIVEIVVMANNITITVEAERLDDGVNTVQGSYPPNGIADTIENLIESYVKSNYGRIKKMKKYNNYAWLVSKSGKRLFITDDGNKVYTNQRVFLAAKDDVKYRPQSAMLTTDARFGIDGGVHIYFDYAPEADMERALVLLDDISDSAGDIRHTKVYLEELQEISEMTNASFGWAGAPEIKEHVKYTMHLLRLGKISKDDYLSWKPAEEGY